MAHFAQLDENNVVTQVIVVADEHEANGENWCNSFIGGTWKQTSYNTRGGVHILGGTPLRKNFAGVDSIYDATKDAFYTPQPYPSWTLNETTCQWDCPVTYPNDGNKYLWNEEITNWEIVE